MFIYVTMLVAAAEPPPYLGTFRRWKSGGGGSLPETDAEFAHVSAGKFTRRRALTPLRPEESRQWKYISRPRPPRQPPGTMGPFLLGDACTIFFPVAYTIASSTPILLALEARLFLASSNHLPRYLRLLSVNLLFGSDGSCGQLERQEAGKRGCTSLNGRRID